MNTIKTIITLVLVVITFATCEENEPGVSHVERKPEPTPAGTPVGTLVTKQIGPDGGTLSSLDGRIELEFPVGALDTNTEITVQPITNNAPGGQGNGYRLGPDGSTFNKPVTLKIHCTGEDVAGTLLTLLGIAFQDTDGIWYSLRKFTWNTTDQTISTVTSHFTDFATFADLVIVGDDRLKVTESREFKIMVIDYTGSEFLAPLAPPKSGDDSELVPMLPQKEVNNSLVKNWAANGVVNGNAQYGTITPNGSHCIFKAPATKPGISKNPVQLSADIDMKYKDPVTGIDFNNLTLVAPVTILDNNAEFKVEVLYEIPVHTIMGFKDVMGSDKADLMVKVENGQVSVSGITNHNTTLNSSGGTDVALCTNSVELDSYDILNVASGTGKLDSYPSGDMVTATFVLGATKNPRWKVKCPDSDPIYFGGDAQPAGTPMAILFPVSLKNDTTLTYLNAWKFVIKSQ